MPVMSLQQGDYAQKLVEFGADIGVDAPISLDAGPEEG